MRTIVIIITLLMALSLASIVAYVSVTGLMKLFAGAGIIGMVFFILIETSKIISTTLLHTFKDKIKGFLRIGLNLFIGITMLITSLGIYGFLSSTYKESFLKSENINSEIELLQKKVDGYEEQLNFTLIEKTTVNETIGELSKGLSNNVIQYKDKETGEIITTTSSSTRKVLESQLDKAIERQSILNVKTDSLNSLVFHIENQILEVKLSDDTATELGPLIFLSDVTGLSMDNVMKWFILLLIIIGDPLAVTMVIAFNKVINKNRNVEGLKVNEIKSDVITDEEIIEKSEKIRLKNIFAKAGEIARKRKEEYGEDDENEPTALANSQYRNEDDFDDGHALDMVMNDVVEELMDGEDIESLEEEKTLDNPQPTPNKTSIAEKVKNLIKNSTDLENNKNNITEKPKETQIEVIETPTIKKVEGIVIDNKTPKKKMGIDRIV